MPRLSSWSIRAALIYLLLGFTSGALILAAKGFPALSAAWQLLPAHVEFLLFGWTAQLILGVAFWILPRFGRGPARGFEPLAWAALIMLNLGVWLVAVQSLAGLTPALAVGGRTLEAAAVAAFGWYAWPRVKPSGA